MEEKRMKIVECPRDAMQGFEHFIPTEQKIRYLNALLKVGFDILDFGSFVSPKAVPQMADTKEVLQALQWEDSTTALLAIVAGRSGIVNASDSYGIKYIGYPFSISETFQQRNTRKSIEQSVDMVQFLLDRADSRGREGVVYLSMGFGNPYGDAWSLALVEDWCGKLIEMGVKTISLSDTVGSADAHRLGEVTRAIVDLYPETEIGVHMHTTYTDWKGKVEA
jgi:hydroxymethylglutaryl-CoA lyase